MVERAALNPFQGELQKLNDITGYLNLKGVIDCSGNPNYPAGTAGDFYVVSVAGKIGGASGLDVYVKDLILCITDNAGGDQATVGDKWDIIPGGGDEIHYDPGTPNNAILKKTGAITAGDITATPPYGVPESLIIPNDEILTFTNDSSSHEVGETLLGANFNWTMTRNLEANTSQAVSGATLDGSPVSVTPGTVRTLAGTFGAGLNPADYAAYSYTLNTVGDDGFADSASTSILFRWKRYWGVWNVTGAGGSVPTDAEIVAAFSGEYGTSKPVTKTFNASAPTPPYNLVFAWPLSWGLPVQTKIGGLDFTDYTSATIVSFVNASGGTTDYYVIYTNNQTSDAAVTWQIVS